MNKQWIVGRIDKIYYNPKSDPSTITIIFLDRTAFKLYSSTNVIEFMRWFLEIYRNEGWDEITQKIVA